VEYDVATTSVGRLLIRTGLACAPGLFNVLAGQMSVVGPEPMAPDNATAQPLLVRPGLTGHWRLEDPSDANTVIGVRDVQNLSAVNDTRTIARTLKLAVTGRLRC
jgi:exopolysaccharide production protein ExoY